MTAVGGVRSALQGALAIDRNSFQPLVAVRAAAGVVIPFAIGIAVGNPADGAIVSAGALPAGIAGVNGAIKSQAGVMIATATGMAVSTFVGSLVAGHTVATLIALIVWGFAAGIVVVLGREATIIGTQAVMGIVVFGRFPGSVAESAVHALLVLAGGGFQGVLAGVFRSPQRFRAERRALASAYDELAAVARDLQRSGLMAASDTATAMALIGRRRSSGDVDLLRGLADEAIRIRLELQSLATLEHTQTVAALTAAAGAWLDRSATAIRSGERAMDEDPALATAVEKLRDVQADAPAGRRGTADRYTLARAAALLGQLRAVDRLATALAGVRRIVLPRGLGTPVIVMLPQRAGESYRAISTTLRDPRSSAFRHAVRLAVILPVSEGLSHVFPWQRGYWVTLTAAVVLKPDFAATTQRGLARVGGTALGVLGAGLLVVAIHPSGTELVILLAIATWAAYASFAASYALFSVVVTAIVVLLLAPLGGNELSTVADRGLDTLAGGALAMIGYVVWPTWERETLAASLARLLQALASYADVVLTAYVDPSSVDPSQIGDAAANARRARASAQASYERAVAEPLRGGADIDTATGVLSATRRIVIELHALRATLDDSTEHEPVPEVAGIRDGITAALHDLAEREAPAVTGLREQQSTLAEDVDADLESLHHRRRALLAAHLDPLVDSVDTLAHVLDPVS